ncbi:MAG: DEDD exnuclease domain-containing protein [Actinobacteria bacterium]|nr:MAG: DEDD exnuclease domain-containing protein [Actinomycetota bacterium]
MPVGAELINGVQRSFDELGTPLQDVTFCVIDLETTGGNRADDSITEIGAVKLRAGECLGTFQTLVNPGRAIPPKITVLTGLSDALVAPAPRIESVLPTLLEFIGDSVIVGHNVGFDVAFLRNALERSGRPRLEATIVDTVALARRLVRDEVPNCRLGTLASKLRLDHQPSHRALDDALATADLLHLLIERASGLGVLGLDDLVALSKLAGHPQAAKLKMTTDLPRRPGVYMFCGLRDEVLYVGKATNLRQRVRSYFGSDDRRKIGPMLREAQSVRHLDLPDPISAEITESRLIAKLLPRYNKAGTRVEKYCYVRLDTDSQWPRLAIVKNPSPKGLHLGPLPSRAMAQLVVDALHGVLPLRRCSARLGRNFVPDPDATACSATQLGVAQCPCAGTADAGEYAAAVDLASRAFLGNPDRVADRLRDKMTDLASQQRFEEAASARDRLSALCGATHRHELVDALRRAGRAEVTLGDSTWIIEHAQLVDAFRVGSAGSALPVPAPDPAITGETLARGHIDEALCLARFCNKRASQLTVSCTGTWLFPVTSPMAA